MSESDKYPEPTDRRRFVKGVVGGAALSGVAVGTAATVESVTNRAGEGGGATEFYGVENTSGPAPRAMPQIVVDTDDEGFLVGRYPEVSERTVGGQTQLVASEEIGDIQYSAEWFQFCGVQTMPGVEPGADKENYFHYAPEGELPSGLSWQAEDDRIEAGDKVHVDHFQDYESWENGIGNAGTGKPAKVTWRSQDEAVEDTLIVEVIRSTRIEEMSGESEWLSASTEQGFLAYLDKCTHFCCVPAFKGYGGSERYGGGDAIYCPCHQSVYDPFSIVRKTFTALPRTN
jgi:Rieske Fe-S protein